MELLVVDSTNNNTLEIQFQNGILFNFIPLEKNKIILIFVDTFI